MSTEVRELERYLQNAIMLILDLTNDIRVLESRLNQMEGHKEDRSDQRILHYAKKQHRFTR